jgi:hypothetical protein
MHVRTSYGRAALAVGASLLLVGLMTGGTVARDAAIITIAIDLDTGVETFTTNSPLLCPSGEATTDFERGAGNFRAAGSFHLTKLLTCDDSSGSFVIRVDAGSNFVVGDGTTGGWSVVPGSGTGSYVGLRGGGSLVGVNSDSPPIDLIDSYFGSLRL